MNIGLRKWISDSDPSSLPKSGPNRMIPLSRNEFFNAYWTALENQGWSSVILHGWENLPEQIHSDVDYLIEEDAKSAILPFLNDFTKKSGWILAQVMEHEPGAFYCVCFMNSPPWSALKLDVSWDYQRKGRTLLPGTFLLDGRYIPSGKAFHVPSAKSEFAYVLAKGMAKSKDPGAIISNLEDLWHRDPSGCSDTLQTHFGTIRDDRSLSFPVSLLRSALRTDNIRFNRWRSRQFRLNHISWLMRRLRRQYGMTVAVSPDIDREQLAETLLPAFRRYHLFESCPSNCQRLKLEYRSGFILVRMDQERKLPAGVIDIRTLNSVDSCVAKVLEILSLRRERSGNPQS